MYIFCKEEMGTQSRNWAADFPPIVLLLQYSMLDTTFNSACHVSLWHNLWRIQQHCQSALDTGLHTDTAGSVCTGGTVSLCRNDNPRLEAPLEPVQLLDWESCDVLLLKSLLPTLPGALLKPLPIPTGTLVAAAMVRENGYLHGDFGGSISKPSLITPWRSSNCSRLDRRLREEEKKWMLVSWSQVKIA
jgi:hypothetical protein